MLVSLYFGGYCIGKFSRTVSKIKIYPTDLESSIYVEVHIIGGSSIVSDR